MRHQRGSPVTLQEPTSSDIAAAGGRRSEETVSKKLFAELIGVSPGRVSQMITKGLPVERNGRINVEIGKAWYRDNVDRNRQRGQPNDDLPDPNSPRRRKDEAEAELFQLKAQEKRGKLNADTERAFKACGNAFGDGLVTGLRRFAAQHAQKYNLPLASVEADFDRFGRDVLNEIADVPIAGLET